MTLRALDILSHPWFPPETPNREYKSLSNQRSPRLSQRAGNLLSPHSASKPSSLPCLLSWPGCISALPQFLTWPLAP